MLLLLVYHTLALCQMTNLTSNGTLTKFLNLTRTNVMSDYFSVKAPLVEKIVEINPPRTHEGYFKLRRELWKQSIPQLRESFWKAKSEARAAHGLPSIA